MNEEKINQVLKNQITILSVLSHDIDNLSETICDNRIEETKELLFSEIKPTLAERTHESLNEDKSE